MQKGQTPILILVGILVIVAVAGGAYLLGKSATPKTSPSLQSTTILQPGPTPVVEATPTRLPSEVSIKEGGPTANWKTYQSEKYGFSIKYPTEFSLQEFQLDLFQNEKSVLARFQQAIDYPIIDIALAKTTMSVREWTSADCPSSSNLCSPLRPGPISGSIQFDSLRTHYSSTHTSFKNNDILFDITLAATLPDKPIPDMAYSVYNQILSSFKFLE